MVDVASKKSWAGQLSLILYPSHRRWDPRRDRTVNLIVNQPRHHRYFHTPGTNLLKAQRILIFVKSHEIFVVNLKSPYGFLVLITSREKSPLDPGPGKGACGAARHAPPLGWGDKMMPGGIQGKTLQNHGRMCLGKWVIYSYGHGYQL